ncbi:MAG: carboxypeptidase-like regulatory domain-containing protein [Paludibacter sp.]|nr:carboxypeptidase-like regulatory domain-containing protein [Paludibacter sp.]
MRTLLRFPIGKLLSVYIIFQFVIFTPVSLKAVNDTPPLKTGVSENFIEYRGKIVDRKSGSPLAFASLKISGMNITTVSNSEGEFSIKIPKEIPDSKIIISFIGYKNKTVLLADLKPDKSRIEMEPSSVELPELSVISKDAEVLIKAVLEKKGENYFNIPTVMTAFYRETIKRNRTYVSLSEAVLKINKQPYTSNKSDIAKLYKARKKADYSKLDTLVFKLQGGPYNSLNLDVMKNPENLFTEDMIKNYEFTFDHSTYEDNKLIYVLNFKQRLGNTDPLYFGKLYIDAQSLALKSAVFSLNIKDKDASASMFIMKKPFNSRVYPTEAKYRIDYLEKDGKWYYAYSRIELGIKIIWKKKLFNTNYFSTVEMAVTDWGKGTEKSSDEFEKKLKPSVIISDEASGFSDPQFWGEYNVIEPEKSIESAIKKIEKQLLKKK